MNGEVGIKPNSDYNSYVNQENKLKGLTPKNTNSLDILKGNVSTPKDFCKILNELINPKIITKKSAQKIMDLMERCTDTNILRKYEFDAKIMHKTGWLFGGSNSVVGIVIGKNTTFVYVIMSTYKRPKKSFMEDYSNRAYFINISNKIAELLYNKFNKI